MVPWLHDWFVCCLWEEIIWPTTLYYYRRLAWCSIKLPLWTCQHVPMFGDTPKSEVILVRENSNTLNMLLRIHCFGLMNWVKLWRAVIHIVMKLQSESNATSPLCWYVRGHPFTKTFQLLQYSSSIIILKGYLPFSGKTFGLSIQGWLLVKYSLQWFSNSFYSMVESICLLPWLPIQLRNICVSEYLAHFCPILQEFRV